MVFPSVATVIVNWNSTSETVSCVRTLLRSDYTKLDIIVVDNGSADSARNLCTLLPAVSVIETGENLGYAGGNNVGVAEAFERGADYVLILNPDVRVNPSTVTALVRASCASPRAAAVGPKIYHRESPSVIQSAGMTQDKPFVFRHRGINEVDAGQWDSSDRVAAISGSVMLVRRRAILEVGLLDPLFFMYHEDVDWCLRMRREGFTVLYVPQAQAWHPKPPALESRSHVTYYMVRNQYLLLRKHGAPTSIYAATAIQHVAQLLNRSVHRKRARFPQGTRRAFLCALVDGLFGRYGRQL